MPHTNPVNSDFIKLLTSHQAVLKGYIISLLPGCQDINDVLQDTNVILWEKMHTFEPGSNFRAWAFATARIKVMHYRDKQKRLNRIVLSDEILDSIAEAREEILPEQLENELVALHHCLENLREEERAMIRARYGQSSTLQSYAHTIGRSAQSARVTLHRIRRKLRSCMDHRLHLKGTQA